VAAGTAELAAAREAAVLISTGKMALQSISFKRDGLVSEACGLGHLAVQRSSGCFPTVGAEVPKQQGGAAHACHRLHLLPDAMRARLPCLPHHHSL